MKDKRPNESIWTNGEELQVYPIDSPTPWRKIFAWLAFWGIVIALALFSFNAEAKPIPPPQKINANLNAIICDEAEQLIKAIDGLDAGELTIGLPLTKGCGYLQEPIPALATPIAFYEAKRVRLLIGTITYSYKGEEQIQYTILGVVPKSKKEGKDA